VLLNKEADKTVLHSRIGPVQPV